MSLKNLASDAFQSRSSPWLGMRHAFDFKQTGRRFSSHNTAINTKTANSAVSAIPKEILWSAKNTLAPDVRSMSESKESRPWVEWIHAARSCSTTSPAKIAPPRYRSTRQGSRPSVQRKIPQTTNPMPAAPTSAADRYRSRWIHRL